MLIVPAYASLISILISVIILSGNHISTNDSRIEVMGVALVKFGTCMLIMEFMEILWFTFIN